MTNKPTDDEVVAEFQAVFNKLAKWRTLYAGRVFGTRMVDDPVAKGARDDAEVRLFLRAEVSALAKLLIDKGVCTRREFTEASIEEAKYLDRQQELIFPGWESFEGGLRVTDIEAARRLMEGWPP